MDKIRPRSIDVSFAAAGVTGCETTHDDAQSFGWLRDDSIFSTGLQNIYGD